ncbi:MULTISPECIES: hypothetical protein [unclassified Bradyrhizobium]|uniref:hypothetical protein n=1 Tax=unclassified Bradyrhizobium TaxID=2631580 RepID=UPI001FFC0240|nr:MULTISPECIES: hypothetical protein [unclassified Bradyrhizobium]
MAEAVGKLLFELGGPGPEFSLEGAKQAALRLIQDPEESFIFVIEEQATGQNVGIAAISAVLALRAAYGFLATSEALSTVGICSRRHIRRRSAEAGR